MGDWVDRVLGAERVRRVAIVVVVANVALYAVIVARGRFPFDAMGTAVLPDFIAHLTAGKLVAAGDGAHLYDIAAQGEVQQGITGSLSFLDLFLSPPLAALLYVPFTAGSYAVAAIAWTWFSALLLDASARVMRRRLMPSVAREKVMLFALVAVSSQPVVQLLGAGQDSAVSLLLWSAGVALALAKRDVAAGLVLSLGLFKPQLFFLAPVALLVMGRWRALAAWAAGAAAQVVATFAVFGAPVVAAWAGILRSPEYLWFLRGQRGVRMSSLVPLFESVTPLGARPVAGALGLAASAALVVAAVWRVGRAVTRRALDERAAWALVVVTTLLATPHLFDYDLTLLVLPVALVLEARGGALARTEKLALAATYVLGWTVAARAGLADLGWPWRALAASWTAVPLLSLWREAPVERASTA
jgi:hypothetical protein